MPNKIAKKLLGLYYIFKHRLNDTLWGENQHRVPIATAALSLLWLLSDISPEPAVVFFTSLIAISVSKKQNNDKWYTQTQGNLFQIDFRADLLNAEEREKHAKQFCKKINFVCKYKVYASEGDKLNTLFIDALFDDDIYLIDKARNHFVTYHVYKNGEQIYQKDS